MTEKFNAIEIKKTFQSRFGPQEWLQPYTDKTLESLPNDGKNVLAICPGFSSDCVETGGDTYTRQGKFMSLVEKILI